MSEVTLGKISSTPDAEGKHSLRCPKCGNAFNAAIQKDDKSDELLPVTCTKCGHSGDPKHFIVAAQQDAVSDLAKDYVASELKKTFDGKSLNINIKL